MNKSDTNLSCYLLQCLSLSEKHVNNSIIDYNVVTIKVGDINGRVRISAVYIYISNDTYQMFLERKESIYLPSYAW